VGLQSRQVRTNMPDKNDNRCWPGYEPAKNKKPNSQGSCRPKPESKLAESDKEFRAKRKRQLKQWQADHPGTRKSAAQHLHAPGAKTKKKMAKKSTRRPARKKLPAASRGKKRK
jgi:hypothetical protein